MTPDEALALLPDFRGGAEIGPCLNRGPVNDTWLVRQAGERYVLRLDTPLAARLGLDRAAELEILRHVHAARVGPEPVAALTDRGILLTRYVPGCAWTPADMQSPERLRRLASLLRRLHGLTPIGPRLALRSALAGYAALLKTAEASELLGEAEVLLRRAESDRPAYCLCHNDPVAANVVGTEAVYLIDWEYAAIGDPFFDLAVVVQHHELNEKHAGELLSAYAGGDAESHWHHLYRCCALYDRVLVLWLLVVKEQSGLNAADRALLAAARSRIAQRPLP